MKLILGNAAMPNCCRAWGMALETGQPLVPVLPLGMLYCAGTFPSK